MKAAAQFITTPSGEEMVLLSRADYDALVAAVEDEDDDAEDVALYDARKGDLNAKDFLPAEVSAMILKGDGRLKAIRRWRRMTQEDLAAATSMSQGYISEVESRRKSLGDEAAASVAKALNVPLSWIL